MRTIDQIRYITAKEYAEMVGITPGRVSQLKASLPFVKFEDLGVELINFELIEIQQQEKLLAQSKFETTTAIHALSYKDLGNFFAKFALEMVRSKGNADQLLEEASERCRLLAEKNSELKEESEQARIKVGEIVEELSYTKNLLQSTKTELEEKTQQLHTLTTAYQKAENELKELTERNTHHQHQITLLTTENQTAAARLEAQAFLKKELQDLKKLIIQKK